MTNRYANYRVRPKKRTIFMKAINIMNNITSNSNKDKDEGVSLLGACIFAFFVVLPVIVMELPTSPPEKHKQQTFINNLNTNLNTKGTPLDRKCHAVSEYTKLAISERYGSWGSFKGITLPEYIKKVQHLDKPSYELAVKVGVEIMGSEMYYQSSDESIVNYMVASCYRGEI